MIAKDSKSYPYLAIAQYYSIDYGIVLLLAERFEDVLKRGRTPLILYAWQRDIVDIVQRNIK